MDNVIELVARFLVVGAFAFGGGGAALPLVERITVAETGWLTPQQFAIGVGFVFVGFEFEYADSSEDVTEAAPSLRTGMGNVLLQPPMIHGFQPYFTTGAGGYREELGVVSETHAGLNTGGGVKIALAGPLRARVDYRVFSLQGDPLVSTVHRFYAGVNLKF